MAKTRTNPQRSIDPAAQQMLIRAEELGLGTAFTRAVAAGSAAHWDHGRDVAFTLLAAAEGQAQGYEIRDLTKLLAVARKFGVPTEKRTVEDIAKDVAHKAIAQFGQQTGELIYVKTAPKKRQELWRKYGVVPRGIDRGGVEGLHRTQLGDGQEAEHILQGAIRCALSDGWG